MKKKSIERCMKDMEHCNGIMHTVRPGDTLYSISMEHKVPLALLLRANPYVDVYNLQVGETVCVPVKVPGHEEMPPYGGTCSKWEIRNAVPAEREEQETASMRQTAEETGKIEQEALPEPKQNGDTGSLEGTEHREKKQEKMGYVTKEGDTLEKILGVDQILLAPGMTICRHK